jgi:hypothetical protein
MNIQNRARRDWGIIVFIIPLGILLIIIVGQIAIRILPNWSITANMRSNLDPNSAPGQPASLLQPLLPQILTPMAWANTYLQEDGDFTFPPFFVFEPTASPSPTPVSPTPTNTTPTTTPTSTPVVTSTTKPPDNNTATPTSTATTPAPTTCQDPLATNFGGQLPCTYPPTTCQDPLATNFGGALPCTYPPTTCQDPLATNFGGALPCTYPTGYPVTIDPNYGTPITPTPTGINNGNPDNTIGLIDDGKYIVINRSVQVGATPDGNYDLVYYEYKNGSYVYLDWIIIGISNYADGSSYYEVFNWGDGVPDTNSNVDTNDIAPDVSCIAPEAPECDNHQVELNDLHDPDGGSNNNQTGVLIDVDNATSAPPAGTYNYIVIISPNGGSSGAEPVELDSIDVTEVLIPTP